VLAVTTGLSGLVILCALLGFAAGAVAHWPVRALVADGPQPDRSIRTPPILPLGLLTAAVFGLLAWRLGPGLDLIAFLVLAAAGVVLTLVDLRALRLPDVVTLVCLLTGLTLLGMESLALGDFGPYVRGLYGGATLGAYHLCLAVLGRGGLGFGDVKLAAVLGLYLAWLGWGVLVVGTCLSFVFAGLAAAALLVTRRARRDTALPFGPWMLAGAFFGVLTGDGLAALFL
jgi:leader peptidase (prepilin peptidase)/N-methyltransferase